MSRDSSKSGFLLFVAFSMNRLALLNLNVIDCYKNIDKY